MKRTFYTSLVGLALLVLMSACGGSSNKQNSGIIQPTNFGTNLSNNFDPNSNLFLNGCPNCQVSNLPCQNTTNGAIATNTACISHPQISPQLLQGHYQDASFLCGQNPASMMGLNSAYQSNPQLLYSQCGQFQQSPYIAYPQQQPYQYYDPYGSYYNQYWMSLIGNYGYQSYPNYNYGGFY